VLKNGDVCCTIDLELVVWNLFFIFVLKCRFHTAFLDNFTDVEHWLFGVVDDVLYLFGLLLVLMSGSCWCANIWNWVVLEKLWIYFDNWNKFHDLFVLCWNVRIQGLFVFSIYLRWFYVFVVMERLSWFVEFCFVERIVLVGFEFRVVNYNILTFWLVFLWVRKKL